MPNCGTIILARSILVLQFEVDQALHFARANLAPHFTLRVDGTKRNIPVSRFARVCGLRV